MQRERLTPTRIARFICPPDREQAYLWDSEAPRLAVRATTAGAKSYVFESKLDRQTIRRTIGDVADWTTEDARAEARRLANLIDRRIDPRDDDAERAAAAQTQREDSARRDALLSEAWGAYVEARRPSWGTRHLADHQNFARLGGEKWKRGERKTNAGPLTSFMPRPLRELDTERLKGWLRDEIAERPTQARLAFGALRAFVNWCADTPNYRGIVDPAIFDNRAVRALLPRKGAKRDCLQREQLRPWFDAVRRLDNPTASAYLQILLLTGARREELAALTWANVNFRWQSLTIRDKVEGERTIPLTPYVAELLRELQRRNVRPLRLKDGEEWEPSPWAFASTAAASGRIADPRLPHHRALRAAGIDGLTLHGLRRSFGTLAEWVECPAGVVAQIMGHKPSATAEKHYRQRPLDLLRLWHSRIEVWILAEAGIEVPNAEGKQAPALEVVSG